VTTGRTTRQKTKRRRTVKPLRGNASTAAHPSAASGASLKKKNALLTRELSEALERETATSKVLGIISSSPSDLEPVFQAMLANATRLCEASYDNPAYHPHYGGGVFERDGGYHQGSVWGWLLGPFCLAVYRVTGDARAALAVLQGMSDALEDQGVGTIGEIFDGEAPHRPRGAPAQAWSVACTLDAWQLLTQIATKQ